MYFLYRGMDPLMFAALTGVVAAGVGFIVGGTLHTEIWKLVNKEKHRQLTQVQLNICITNCYGLQARTTDKASQIVF